DRVVVKQGRVHVAFDVVVWTGWRLARKWIVVAHRIDAGLRRSLAIGLASLEVLALDFISHLFLLGSVDRLKILSGRQLTCRRVCNARRPAVTIPAMNAAQLVEWLKTSEHARHIQTAHCLPARPPRFADWPAALDERIVTAMRRRGIERPYIHQAEAIEIALQGESCVVVTPTASGKTLCYNLPVLNAILNDPEARALYLFPTKALAQDQLAELQGVVDGLSVGVKTYTYDGDTP